MPAHIDSHGGESSAVPDPVAALLDARMRVAGLLGMRFGIGGARGLRLALAARDACSLGCDEVKGA